MGGDKSIKLNNKSDKPDNIVLKEHEILSKCEGIQHELPNFMRGFFAYLRGNVLPMTRLAYLSDIKFFCRYLIDETELTDAENISDIKSVSYTHLSYLLQQKPKTDITLQKEN